GSGSGRAWAIVRRSVDRLGYSVRGTEHVASGGHGLISPHHLGYPQTRERFFAVASLDPLPADPFPRASSRPPTKLADIVEPNSDLDRDTREETAVSADRIRSIEHWNELLQAIPDDVSLPWFPIWGDEIHACYPYDGHTPHSSSALSLLSYLGRNGTWLGRSKREILELLPSYAR